VRWTKPARRSSWISSRLQFGFAPIIKEGEENASAGYQLPTQSSARPPLFLTRIFLHGFKCIEEKARESAVLGENHAKCRRKYLSKRWFEGSVASCCLDQQRASEEAQAPCLTPCPSKIGGRRLAIWREKLFSAEFFKKRRRSEIGFKLFSSLPPLLQYKAPSNLTTLGY
jgi:hypothetical protein